MADILRKPTVTVNGYKCVSAQVSCMLNRPIIVNATVCSGDTDGGILTTDDIMNLAKEMQAKIFEDPSEGDLQLSMSDGESGTLNYNRLIITSCDVVAATSGGLMATITATSPDILADLVDPSVYMKYVDTADVMFKTASDYKGSKAQDHFWVYQLQDKGGNNLSVANKLLKLLENAKDKYRFREEGLTEGTKAAVNSQKAINNSFFRYVRQFLRESDDTTRVLNGKAEINDTVNRAIYNTLAHNMFEIGGGVFSKLLNYITSEFLLWYIPNHKTGEIGILKNWDYEGSDMQTISVPISTAKLAIGRALGNDLPPTLVVAESPLVFTQHEIAENYSAWISGSYPEKAETKLGKVYNIQAPRWFSVGQDVSPNKPANKLNVGRNPSQTIETADKAQKQISKNAKSSNQALTYLAKQSFFKYKFGTSVAGITCPFKSNIDANIGDFVQVNAEGGGKILQGILSTVTHNLSTGSLSTELGFTRVEI